MLVKYDIDILFLTETKIKSIHEEELRKSLKEGYEVIFNSNQNSWFHGTAFVYKNNLSIEVLARELPKANRLRIYTKLKNHKIVYRTLPEDLDSDIAKAHFQEGRIISILCRSVIPFVIVGTYVPNSGSDRKTPFKRLGYRTMHWDPDMYSYLRKLEKEYKYVMWIGDLNVTRFNNDMFRKGLNCAGTSEEERINFSKFLEKNKWCDTFHELNPNLYCIEDRCTFGVDCKFKLRLDYILTSPSLTPYILESKTEQRVTGSDHCPVSCVLKC